MCLVFNVITVVERSRGTNESFRVLSNNYTCMGETLRQKYEKYIQEVLRGVLYPEAHTNGIQKKKKRKEIRKDRPYHLQSSAC